MYVEQPKRIRRMRRKKEKRNGKTRGSKSTGEQR
jgi:hypothetical protein